MEAFCWWSEMSGREFSSCSRPVSHSHLIHEHFRMAVLHAITISPSVWLSVSHTLTLTHSLALSLSLTHSDPLLSIPHPLSPLHVHPWLLSLWAPPYPLHTHTYTYPLSHTYSLTRQRMIPPQPTNQIPNSA